MTNNNKQHLFLPIILGTDINAYTMAISFHAEYNIKPVLIGKIPMAFTKNSSIIEKIYYEKSIENEDKFVNILNAIASQYKSDYDYLILIGTNDQYVSLIINNQEHLNKHFHFNYMEKDLLPNMYLKKNFYALCDQHGIDTPLTYFYSCKDKDSFNEKIPFPAIIKPSNGVEYYKHSFEGMQKVYKVESNEELNKVIDQIKASGYEDDLIIQDFIPGDDTYMWDAVYYGNKDGFAQLITFAQVILQEHTKTGVGNYTALIVRHHQEMMTKLVNFFEAINYKGFANADLKFDKRDGKFKVFEVNVRQGRSSYYLTQCGHNMARYFVEDIIENKHKDVEYLNCEQVFSVVPKGVLRKYVTDKEIVAELNALIKNKKYENPLFYRKDKNLIRLLMMFLRQVNYFRKYKTADWQR